MPIYQNQTDYNQFNQNNASNQGYDLAAEKQRIADGTEEIKKELQEKWQRRYANAQIFPDTLSGMSQNLINFLLFFEHTLFYNDLAKKFQLSQEQRDVLPQIVWHLCQNKNWENLNGLLRKNIAVDSATSEQIAQNLTTQILSKAKELSSEESFGVANARQNTKQEEDMQSSLLQMPLPEALKEIPEIGEQLLTSEKIHILSFPEPVRPSLKNWLADYTSFFGYAKHSPIEMGNYLFHSENTKKLTSSDRQKLTYILKAFNDETPVNINKTLKQVVFPTMTNQIPNNQIQTPVAQQIRNNQQDARYKIQDTNNIQTTNSNFPNKFEDANYQIQDTNRKIQTPAPQQIRNSNIEARNNNQIQNPNFSNMRAQQTSEQEMGRMQQTPNLQNALPQTTNQEPPTERLTFSSPHTLPYEQKKEMPEEKPYFSAPVAPANLPTRPFQASTPNRNTIVLEKKPDPPRPMGKNVVDLREQ